MREITIVSGGQTGADRAALDFALEFGIEHGGWCPRGRRAEDGVIDERYGLTETPSHRYDQRTRWNVRDSDATAGNLDVLRFTTGIATDQLWFRALGNDLEVSIIGTNDRATVKDWYLGSQNHLEQFRTADGKVLLDTAVDNLVNAMASFAPPAVGQTTLTASYQASLSAVIAANWS